MAQHSATRTSAVVAVATSVSLDGVAPSALGANGLPKAVIDPSARVGPVLEANLVLFGDSGCRLLMISIDALFVGPTLSRRVREAVSRAAPDVELWLSATHTHRAPATDVGKPRLGVVQADVLNAIADRVSTAAFELLADQSSNRWVSPRISTANMDGLSVHRRARGRIRLTHQGLRVGASSWHPISSNPCSARPCGSTGSTTLERSAS